MSIELCFWKYRESEGAKNNEVYAQLSDGQFANGVAELPIEDILNQIDGTLKDWNKVGEFQYETDGGLIEVYATAQFVRFDCWQVPQEIMNLLIDIMREYGCPLYDPVIDVRFC